MKRKKLIVVGNGMAGIRCVEEILQLGPELFDITIFGAEPRPNYNRILLSKVLQGEHSLQDIILNDWSWYERHGIRLLTGEAVHHIDVKARCIETVSGKREGYDALILATGSSPFVPPIPGTDKEGVISFRTVDDCTKMTEMSRVYTKAAVIGGGLLGLEAARGLLHLGMETHVVHNAPYIMNRQLDRTAAHMLQRELESQGMRFHLAMDTTRIVGRTRVQGLRFIDGTRLDADVVVLAVGIRPNVELAQRSGLLTGRAILVDDFMRTSEPNIYAVGECAEHRGISYGLIAPLYEQGKVLARVICGRQAEPYVGSIPYSQLKVSGVDVFSAGAISGIDVETAIQQYDAVSRTYKKVIMHKGRVTGAILFGDTTEGSTLLSMVKKGAAVSELIPQEGMVSSAEAAAQTLPDHETVCACNGVSKAEIMQAVTDRNLQSTDEVKQLTRASGSCGGCRPMVDALVKHARSGKKGGAQRAAITQGEIPVCECTKLGHSSLKQAIAHAVSQGCHTISDFMLHQGWKKPGGCMACRPALRYYLEMTGIGNGDEPVRKTWHHVSDADHGLYQGVQVWMGDTEGSRMEAAGIQRIGEWLRLRWQEVSLPYPVHAGVSDRLASSVSILVQGIGISASPAGWEVYLGGHADHPVREGQLIGVAEREEDVMQLVSACLQWYRQNGLYEEPLWKWVERTGVTSIREHVLDHDLQRELAEMLSRREWKTQVG
ncbi:nitrite reductase large subunit NirB [Paenibacillus sp. Y412MC10]|uniref:nitrite reductase large subunit NirB n=1 Tax=Geobacillus sp. (strain Y412MC10) TaxID=481743 RepID=UPI0001787F9E|nr:nitrite reductase large subunit NirB [Paenibacillus sp. Y412MC10]ACX64783.1 nitrite reductase (NAD(P)H), large subunit [Paenibacillus sp. Y412MC10]